MFLEDFKDKFVDKDKKEKIIFLSEESDLKKYGYTQIDLETLKDYLSKNIDEDYPAEIGEYIIENLENLPKDIFEQNENEEKIYGDQPMLGVTRWNARNTSGIKHIKYKGNFVRVEYDEKQKIWIGIPVFRNVLDAIKFGKKMMDFYLESQKN